MSTFSLKRWLLAALLVAPLTGFAQSTPPSVAAKAADISVEAFFRHSAYDNVTLSADGKMIAATAPVKGRRNLVVIDIEKRRAAALTSFDKFDVSSLRWVGPRRLLFSVGDRQEATGRFNFKGQYAIDADGQNLRELISDDPNRRGPRLRVDTVFAAATEEDPRAVVAMYERSRDYVDVYKLDFKTLRFELLSFDSPGRVGHWVLDSTHVPRVAVRDEPRERNGAPQYSTVWVRSAADAKWAKVFTESSWRDGDSFDPIGIDADDRTLYLAHNQGRERMAVYKYDLQTGKMGDLVAEDPIVDINISDADVRLLRDSKTRQVIGLSYQGPKPTTIWFDEKMKQRQQRIDATFAGANNRMSFSSDGAVALIYSESDVNPGAFYLWHQTTDKIELIAKTRDWLDPKLMAERRVIRYTARDGMPVMAYLTVPRGVDAKNLPLIVNIHGGPQVRAYRWAEWGRWPEAQFFASRGYAVLEPEPRGSTGFGRKHLTSAFKQWGGTMQDDLTDGALALVKDGIVDRNRMCLHGGSYGGYASLQGLVKEPDLFKCANSFVAVTDLELIKTLGYSDTNEVGDYTENEFLIWIGDPKTDAQLFQTRSPARNAQAIKGAVMLTMGSDDQRVPLRHGTDMRDALIKAGKSVEWKVYADEGHGFNREENVIDFYTRSVNFFDANLKK